MQLTGNFLARHCNHTAGYPMRQDVKWTNMSGRQISCKLGAVGTPANNNIVSKLLYDHGCRRRKAQEKRTMGQHADRNVQFENIDRLKKEYLDTGHLVINIDTKKKGFLGSFYRDGVPDAVNPSIVNDHDFPSNSDVKVIPHGIYTTREDEASLHLNASSDTSSDTSEFACESIEM